MTEQQRDYIAIVSLKGENNMTTYHLQSAAMIHTPGVLRWAINGYKFPKDRKYLRSIFHKGWGLPHEAVDALLSERVPHVINDENGTVSFTYPAEVAA